MKTLLIELVKRLPAVVIPYIRDAIASRIKYCYVLYNEDGSVYGVTLDHDDVIKASEKGLKFSFERKELLKYDQITL